ncbi:hypothetical protein BHM03_00049397 [Ensete ventricosum]|nr:hypothetical protein BHM03_00049397 [Ensete ventricosum]
MVGVGVDSLRSYMDFGFDLEDSAHGQEPHNRRRNQTFCNRIRDKRSVKALEEYRLANSAPDDKRLVKYYSNDMVHLLRHWTTEADPMHTGNLTRVIRHPTLRDDPNILALEGGPMSQDCISNLFHSRVTEEAVPPIPTPVAMPQIATHPRHPNQGLWTGDSLP